MRRTSGQPRRKGSVTPAQTGARRPRSPEPRLHSKGKSGPDPYSPAYWGHRYSPQPDTGFFPHIDPIFNPLRLGPARRKNFKDFRGTSSNVPTEDVQASQVKSLRKPKAHTAKPRTKSSLPTRLIIDVDHWNLGCGFAQNTGELLTFRFLAGLGGSAVGGMLDAEERGKAIAIFSLAPLLGPVVGPLCGAFIFENSSAYAPFLREQKANRIRKSQDAEKGPVREVRSRFCERRSDIALTRPFIMFYYEPIIQVLGVYMAFIYGLFYLFITSMPLMFQGTYHESVGISGINYIALGIGVTGASRPNAQFMDYMFRRLREKNSSAAEPEYRVPSMLPGTIALPANVHWIVPDIGIALAGAGIILNFQSIQIYVVDAFSLYPASALAAVAFLRSLCGFAFPLFGQQVYTTLGYGKGDTMLAVVAVVIGCPAPPLLWKSGKQIRMRSKFAKRPTGVPAPAAKAGGS
ncbi:MFS polyamine transporter [Mycena leptocephala]|nr:MFS polyamine transporter [Mycena leptocephala]